MCVCVCVCVCVCARVRAGWGGGGWRIMGKKYHWYGVGEILPDTVYSRFCAYLF